MQSPEVQNVINSLGIVGRSPMLMEALNKAVQVAPYDVTVLVTGENGSGKDFFYKILHNGSRRRHKKCIAVNCGGLPEGTIDSELFGHVKGAFTGAVADRKGYFEEVDGGTIFLDEVGDLPMAIQAKLLRVLDKGEIIRMGSSEVRKVDVRVVAATNVDLKRAISEGRFREDLYYRLSTVRIQVPALRERREDIHLLFRRFASDTASKYRMTRGIELTDDARLMLESYDWPGNVRQLLHVVEEMTIAEMDRVISRETLAKYLKFETAPKVNEQNKEDAFGQWEKIIQLYQMVGELKRELDEVRSYLGLHGSHLQHKPRQLVAQPSDSPIVSSPTSVNAIDTSLNKAQESLDEMIQEVEAEDWDSDSQDIDAATQRASQQPMHRVPGNEDRPRTMEEIEHDAIENAMRRNGDNKRKAAKELGISERTIHRKTQEEK